MAEAKITLAGGGDLKKHAAQLQRLGERKAREVMSRALNEGGEQGRSAMFRALKAETHINYQKLKYVIAAKKSTPGNLDYQLEGRGNETNIGMFRAVQRKKGVSAAPWGTKRMFAKSFIVPSFNGKVYVRKGKARFPIKPLYGPNIAREMRKDAPMQAWESAAVAATERRLIHHLGRLFK